RWGSPSTSWFGIPSHHRSFHQKIWRDARYSPVPLECVQRIFIRNRDRDGVNRGIVILNRRTGLNRRQLPGSLRTPFDELDDETVRPRPRPVYTTPPAVPKLDYFLAEQRYRCQKRKEYSEPRC